MSGVCASLLTSVYLSVRNCPPASLHFLLSLTTTKLKSFFFLLGGRCSNRLITGSIHPFFCYFKKRKKKMKLLCCCCLKKREYAYSVSIFFCLIGVWNCFWLFVCTVGPFWVTWWTNTARTINCTRRNRRREPSLTECSTLILELSTSPWSTILWVSLLFVIYFFIHFSWLLLKKRSSSSRQTKREKKKGRRHSTARNTFFFFFFFFEIRKWYESVNLRPGPFWYPCWVVVVECFFDVILNGYSTRSEGGGNDENEWTKKFKKISF